MMPLDQRLRMMRLACVGAHGIMALERAGVVQLVEHLLAKEKVTGSSPVARSVTASLVAATEREGQRAVKAALLLFRDLITRRQVYSS